MLVSHLSLIVEPPLFRVHGKGQRHHDIGKPLQVQLMAEIVLADRVHLHERGIPGPGRLDVQLMDILAGVDGHADGDDVEALRQ